MKKALLVILVALTAFTSKAQLAGVELDVFVEHNGVVGTTDLTGFTVLLPNLPTRGSMT